MPSPSFPPHHQHHHSNYQISIRKKFNRLFYFGYCCCFLICLFVLFCVLPLGFILFLLFCLFCLLFVLFVCCYFGEAGVHKEFVPKKGMLSERNLFNESQACTGDLEIEWINRTQNQMSMIRMFHRRLYFRSSANALHVLWVYSFIRI